MHQKVYRDHLPLYHHVKLAVFQIVVHYWLSNYFMERRKRRIRIPNNHKECLVLQNLSNQNWYSLMIAATKKIWEN